MIAPLHRQATRRLSFAQDYLIVRLLVLALVKTLLCLELHIEKLADAIFVPADFAQIASPAALKQFEQKSSVFCGRRSQADQVIQIVHVRNSSRTSSEFKL